uniref:sigma-54-dependent Fis family transcriptional regulator n=1 Tax=Thaumasiovibrio occultus TaxID=1891184 RepID=UPI000B357838|nr:sigma-54-dependent Fis family transcriptional regulator [Thaumasiovibrio occultus]
MELHTLKDNDWLLSSWHRCSEAGLTQRNLPQDTRVSRVLLEERRHHAKTIINAVEQCALPLFSQVMAKTDSRLILTDNQGVVIGSWGQERFRDRLTTIALNTGACWLERLKGTNAIGTALVEKKPVMVVGAQHFIHSHRFISCSASPICDADGNIIAILDITSEEKTHNETTHLLVHNMVLQVENHLLQNLPNVALRLRIAAQSSVLSSGWEGIIVADENGTVIAHNRIASQLTERGDLVGCDINEIAQASSQMKTLVTQTETLSKPARRVRRYQPALHYGEPRIEEAWQQANHIVGHDISLLILGETGVGKGEFVKTLHQQSPRSTKPLVTVNCGALPANLIESELFGHTAGAFTGANSKGYLGKVRQANHGILFLDEIGEMPLDAQCRLLGVLQDKQVTPLGSTQSYNIDIQIIAATHQNLQELVAQGRFRQDLYYRLNGLVIDLPPLRQRHDKAHLIRAIYAKYAQPTQQLDSALFTLLSQHTWPGNLRELDNVLKVATLMSQGEAWTTPAHIPSHLRQHMTQSNVNQLPATPEALKETVDTQLMATYQAQQGNVSRTAKLLGISRNTVYRKLRALGVQT